MSRYECDCGAVYDSVNGIEACHLNNHGQPWPALTWDQMRKELLKFLEEYPPDVFDGSSGDPGPLFIVALRKAVEDLDAAMRKASPTIKSEET